MAIRDQRLRDPVHGLIVFRADNALDQLAWRLLDAPEFQRLRRIKQLGVSEFIFPSATHSRFAHCVGVFHTARQLIGIIEREIAGIGEQFDRSRADVAVIAALLHDLGHGPFSHTFESVQKSLGSKKRHEIWTAEIIRNLAAGVAPLLEEHKPGFAAEVAALLEAEDPADIYHAVVSSSFDADRLDYLRRDRLMTGTQAGAIDFDWLMEHVRVRLVVTEAADANDESVEVPTFCLDIKALPAAEQFLLARYTLHEQVYLHKTTRCIEHMIAKLLGRVAVLAAKAGTLKQAGLGKNHPLARFFAKDGATLENYLALDDVVVMGAFDAMTRAEDGEVAELARRLRERKLYKTLDAAVFGSDKGKQAQCARRIDKQFDVENEASRVIKDEDARIGIYTQIGGDDDRTHKKLHILDAGKPREITDVSPLIKALAEKRTFTRYYFEKEEDRDKAKQGKGEAT